MGIFDNVTWSDAANVVTPWFLKKEFVQGLKPFAEKVGEQIAYPSKILSGEKPFNLPSDQPDLTEAAGTASLMPAGSTVGLALGMAPKGNVAGTFGTKLTPGAPMEKYGKFLDMEASGKHRDPIWKETGWGRFADDIPRWEFSDHLAKINDKALRPDPPMGPGYSNYDGPMEGILSHPELYERHPEARNTKTWAALDPTLKQRYGAYQRRSDSKYAEKDYPPRESSLSDAFIEAEVNPTKPDSSGMSLLDIILHEATHGVQHKEGTTRGFAPEDFLTSHPDYKLLVKARKQQGMGPKTASQSVLHEMYRRQAEEVEANLVPARKSMLPKERLKVPPWNMMEYPFEKQILGEYDTKLWTPQARGRPKGFERPYKSQAELEHAELMQWFRELDAKKGRR